MNIAIFITTTKNTNEFLNQKSGRWSNFWGKNVKFFAYFKVSTLLWKDLDNLRRCANNRFHLEVWKYGLAREL